MNNPDFREYRRSFGRASGNVQASTGQLVSWRASPDFSLQPARSVIGNAKASRENAASLHGQLGEMQNFLGRRFDTGEPIPTTLTPRRGSI